MNIINTIVGVCVLATFVLKLRTCVPLPLPWSEKGTICGGEYSEDLDFFYYVDGMNS